MAHGKLLDGKAIAEKTLERLKTEIAQARGSKNRAPGLCTVLVGDDPASQVYVRNKHRRAKEVGMESFHFGLPVNTTTDELLELVKKLNADERVDGILVQLPLPPSVDSEAVLSAVDPLKDVDGFCPQNAGMLFLGEPRFTPCTPKGCLLLIKESGVDIRGAHAVVVGRSRIVGRPMAQLLLKNDATVTICHRYTQNLPEITRQADILVVAVGHPQLIGKNHVKSGAVVIDVGITKLEDGEIVGDVDTQAVMSQVRSITPVPGGVGPMTIAMLLDNTFIAYKLHLGI